MGRGRKLDWDQEVIGLTRRGSLFLDLVATRAEPNWFATFVYISTVLAFASAKDGRSDGKSTTRSFQQKPRKAQFF
jgi:hypothetical protein